MVVIGERHAERIQRAKKRLTVKLSDLHGILRHYRQAEKSCCVLPEVRPAIAALYPVRYFAARDCALAPNTLAAALLSSSFRNKDFASFFSCSDTSA